MKKYNYICVPVTPKSPRVVVAMAWETVPAGEHRLYVRRLGDADAFAYYPAIETNAAQDVFQVDELLFDKGPGRYEAKLFVNAVEYAVLQLSYAVPNQFVGAENPNV